MKSTVQFQNSFVEELPGDDSLENHPRQVKEASYSLVNPATPPNPTLVHYSKEMMKELGFSKGFVESQEFLEIFSGKKVVKGSQPYAMCYGGHQFGHWAGQLGDGRAINLGSVHHDNKDWVLQLKGAGPTPYSRSADGFAVLRSSIREHLCSEAMYHLGVPTTRSLSLILSGDSVMRDMMYDGNPEYEKGAIFCRVAPTFLRFGNFQIFAARRDDENLTKLLNYTIRHHFPESEENTKEGYLSFFQKVVDSTLEMVIHWQRVGFVHGVMNTDNMSILGLTIDYGPYGWLDVYDPDWTPNTTDRQSKRYRFDYQPWIALWNLYQLANALMPIIDDKEAIEEILEGYKIKFAHGYHDMMRAKLGFQEKEDSDIQLIKQLIENLTLIETDMTIFFRNLSKIEFDGTLPEVIKDSFYFPDSITKDQKDKWVEWFQLYSQRLSREKTSREQRQKFMNQTNPKYVLRNYMAQMAIDAADKGDYSLIDELYTMLTKPYDEQPEYEKWFAKRPEWARDKVGCSMLSCSS